MCVCACVPVIAVKLFSRMFLLNSRPARPSFLRPPSFHLNAGKYAVSSKGDIGVAWNDDYASKGYEYFDVWAPEIATHYGEVIKGEKKKKERKKERKKINIKHTHR